MVTVPAITIGQVVGRRGILDRLRRAYGGVDTRIADRDESRTCLGGNSSRWRRLAFTGDRDSVNAAVADARRMLKAHAGSTHACFDASAAVAVDCRAPPPGSFPDQPAPSRETIPLVSEMRDAEEQERVQRLIHGPSP